MGVFLSPESSGLSDGTDRLADVGGLEGRGTRHEHVCPGSSGYRGGPGIDTAVNLDVKRE